MTAETPDTTEFLRTMHLNFCHRAAAEIDLDRRIIAQMRGALTAAKAAMLRTRAASIAGCEEGYGKPQLWADELFASHGDLTKAITLCESALSTGGTKG